VVAFDPDSVEDVNAGNQAYNGDHVGMAKVDALAMLGSGLPLTTHLGPFPLDKGPDELGPLTDELIVVSGVDSFAMRAAMANYAYHHNAMLFVDTRAMGEVCVVCIVPHELIPKYLSDEVISDDEVPDVPCGLAGTAYVGMYVAGRVVSGVNAYLSGLPNVPFIRVEDVHTGEVHRSDLMKEVVTG